MSPRQSTDMFATVLISAVLLGSGALALHPRLVGASAPPDLSAEVESACRTLRIAVDRYRRTVGSWPGAAATDAHFENNPARRAFKQITGSDGPLRHCVDLALEVQTTSDLPMPGSLPGFAGITMVAHDGSRSFYPSGASVYFEYDPHSGYINPMQAPTPKLNEQLHPSARRTGSR